jgi:cobalt-zinc-cadmium efflux system membrane fusion protein
MIDNSVSRAFVVAFALLALAACSPDNGERKAPSASNLILTDAQKKNIRIFAVEPSSFHKTVDTNGIVDFDNDQATSVMSPISGPVSRLLVSPGTHVSKGQPLATVASPDYATAIGAYRTAIVAAAAARSLANMDKDFLDHKGV